MSVRRPVPETGSRWFDSSPGNQVSRRSGVEVARLAEDQEDPGQHRGAAPRKKQASSSRQQTADSRQQTADSRRQTADGRQQTADKGACSSIGRAPGLQPGGRRFDPGHVHHFDSRRCLAALGNVRSLSASIEAGVEQAVGSADCKSVVARPWWFDSTRRHHIAAAMVESVRRLVAIEEIAGAEPAGRSNILSASRSKADRPPDKGQTVERYHGRRPCGGRRQRDEPSGRDPELSRCESGRSPQRSASLVYRARRHSHKVESPGRDRELAPSSEG